MKTVTFDVALGYTIEQKSIRLTLEQAEKILLGKKQARVTKAVRDEYFAELISHFIRCPFCNHKVYAYPKDMKKAYGIKTHPGKRVEKSVISDWFSPQLSLFEESDKPLDLNSIVNVTDDLVCPSCNNTMSYAEGTRRVEITRNRHKVCIRAEVMDIMELFSMPYISEGEITADFPLYETVCFNFNNGHSYIRLEAPDGKCISVRDVTNLKNEWNSGAVYNILQNNKYVKRAVKNMFLAEWGEKIPFFPSELDIDKMKLLTRFVGFDKEFYSSIPLEKDSLEIEKSFKLQARKMQRAENIVELYSKSSLPQIKSVRRLFFKNAGFFFYVTECEKLWQIIGDPNYFVTLFNDSHIYQLLSYLHMRPIAFDFIADYVKMVGVKQFLKIVCESWRYFCRYAVNYSSMSIHMKKHEQIKWKNRQSGNEVVSMPSFAIPMCKTNDKIRDCTIDGFEFSWLKTSVDYEEAGEQLNNCLKNWKNDQSPVICVKKHGKIIAALEVKGDSVFQAFTSNNGPMKKIPGLISACYRWNEKNNLSECYYEDFEPIFDDFDMDDDDLPF